MIVYVIDKDIHEKLEIRNPVDNYDMIEEIERMFDNDIVVSKIHDNYFMTKKTYNWYKTFADFCNILFEIDNYIQENYNLPLKIEKLTTLVPLSRRGLEVKFKNKIGY